MNEADKLQALSALADGECGRDQAAAVTAAWHDDAELRSRWHAYQLIGDALRSDELAGGAGDAAFLQRLRGRLEQEPVVLAPAGRAEDDAPAATPLRARSRLRRWGTPAAVAAGFVMVVGALTVTRNPLDPATDSAAPQLAVAPAPAEPQLVGPQPVATALAERAPGGAVLIRDARLDEYLKAHNQFGGSSALGVPSGFLRSATYEGPGAAAAGSR